MNNIDIIGLTPYSESEENRYSFTKDFTIDFKEEIKEITKIYLKFSCTNIESFFKAPYKSSVFFKGTATFRIEYNTEKNLYFKDFSFPILEEILLKKDININTNNNVNIYTDIFVNDIFEKKLSNNSIFIATFLTTTLEFI